jgi:hypothetical protein
LLVFFDWIWIDVQDACRFFLYESGFALFVALLINIAIISVSGTVCFGENLSVEDADRCSDLSLDNSSFLLKVRKIFLHNVQLVLVE